MWIIYPFEKIYIVKSLDELIKRTDERIKTLEAKDARNINDIRSSKK